MPVQTMKSHIVLRLEDFSEIAEWKAEQRRKDAEDIANARPGQQPSNPRRPFLRWKCHHRRRNRWAGRRTRYIAALAPDADETSQSQQAKFPVTDVF